MAIDPGISLSVRPPVIPPSQILNPVEQFGQILSLRNLMTQGQSGQLELQTRQLNLDQLRRQMQEQQDYADAMKAYAEAAGSPTAPAGAAPLQTAPVVPPVTPTAPPITPPYTPVAPYTPVTGASPAPLSALMTPQPPAPQTQAPAAAAPAAQAPAMGNPGLSRLGGMNAAQFISRFPLTGLSRIKEAFALDQAEAEAGIKQHDYAMGKADEVGRAAIAVRDSKDPATQFVTELTGLGNKGLLPWPTVRQMISDGYDAHKNDIDAFIAKAQDGQKYSEIQKNNIAAAVDKRNLAREDYAQVNGQSGHDQFLARYPEMRPVLGDTFSPDVKDAFLTSKTDRKDLPKVQMDAAVAAAQILEPARAKGQEAYDTALAQFPKYIQDRYRDDKTPLQVRQHALTAEQATTAAQAAATAAETAKQHGLENVFKAVETRIAGQKSVREENIYQQTYGEGANPSLVGVDPKLRTQVTREAQKIGDEYIKAQAAADQFQSVLDLAKAGNKAAGSNLPLLGVETLNAINGIKRMNGAELKTYSGTGSLVDKVIGEVQGLTVGQPIPADVLKDMETMHNALRQNSETEFKSRRQGLNDVYKSNFPTDAPRRGGAQTVTPDVQRALSGAERGKIHQLSDGSVWLVNADGSIQPATAPKQ